MHSATGQQFSLSLSTTQGQLTATITQVGAALREFKINDIELVEPFAIDQHPPYCAGIIMSPWVNRLDKGQWVFEGKVRQNNITIFDQQNSNHGLLIDQAYELVAKTDSSVVLKGIIYPRAGYPFLVETTVTYELTEVGLTVTHTAVNQSAQEAPYATGGHPYFKFGAADTGDLFLRSDAATLTEVDDRQIPVGTSPTAGSRFDMRAGVRIQDEFYDNNFTDLPRDEAGLAHTYLTTKDGRGLDIWQDQAFKHVVIFTPSFFPKADGTLTHAAAIEPSTAAPNAFNNEIDLIWLQPGVEFKASWGAKVSS